MMMQDTRIRWVVAVDGEVRFTTETDNKDEAELWVDQNLEPDTSYEIMSTTPETSDFSQAPAPPY